MKRGINNLNLEIATAKNGMPVLKTEGKFVYSSFDPVREAERAASLIHSQRISIIGLGLGYLAAALDKRLTKIYAFEGESERLKELNEDYWKKLSPFVYEYSSLSAVEKGIVLDSSRGAVFIIEPSLEYFPKISSGIKEILSMLKEKIRVTIIHLRTAGDVLRSIRSVQQLKKLHPEWFITFITEKPYGNILSMADGIDKVVEVEADNKVELPRQILVVNFGAEEKAAEIVETMNPVLRAGFVKENGKIKLVDDRNEKSANELAEVRNKMNRCHFYQILLGVKPDYEPPTLIYNWQPEDFNVVQFGAGSGALVWEAKRIPAEIIGKAIRKIGGRWIAVGSKDEADLARDAGISEEDIYCGKTDWKGLAELLSKAKLYIGNDSGPTHLAAAIGAAVLCLFGFTSPILNAPIGRKTLVLQADMSCAFKGCRQACNEKTCVNFYNEDLIIEGINLLRAETLNKKMEAAYKIRAAGFRYFLSGINIENFDPFRNELLSEPSIGLPKNQELALIKEWIEKRERY